MKGAVLLALLLWQAAAANEPPVATSGAMQYERAVRVEAGTGQACAVLDAAIFPHAAPSLTDVRIFPETPGVAVDEVPYAITLSEAASAETLTARLLNLGSDASGAKIVFDLEMPAQAYTDVTLDLDPAVHDYIATATVSGSDALGGRGKATALGSFTLFDLASQHLSRDTTIPLQESTFKYLHVELHFSLAPGAAGERFVPAMVRGATVPPSREAQSLYTTVAQTTSIATKGRESVATFEVPPQVPVERVSLVLAPGFAVNFSRDVKVSAVTDADLSDDGRAPLTEVVTGSIQRVHTSEAGHEISTEQLAVDAILGANLQHAAKVTVTIENGDDQPLPIAAVRLEMRQRKICFEAPRVGGASLALFYGDSRLAAPQYDYARLFVASRAALVAELGPEVLNPNYRTPAAPLRPFADRHPELLWIALIIVICALGVVALKTARNVGR